MPNTIVTAMTAPATRPARSLNPRASAVQNRCMFPPNRRSDGHVVAASVARRAAANAVPPAAVHGRDRQRRPGDMTDLDAADVVWDLSDLLDGSDDEAAVIELLDEADVLTDRIATYRGRVADLDAAELFGLVTLQAELSDLIGRAGSWASLRFSVDVTDPTRGALMQRVEERATVMQTKLLWF